MGNLDYPLSLAKAWQLNQAIISDNLACHLNLDKACHRNPAKAYHLILVKDCHLNLDKDCHLNLDISLGSLD